MSVIFVDTTNKPRSIEEFEEALKAIQKEFLGRSVSPLLIHYVVIIDALRELIHIRKTIEKGD